MKWHYDEELANYPVQWIEEYCTYPDGPMAGEPLEMLDYFKEITREAFGWVDGQGNLKHNVIYCEVPRGNAKSTNGSAVALFLLYGYLERAREIYCCAGTREQAGKVFEPARMMVLQDSDLSELSKVTDSRKLITNKETFSFLKATAAEGFRQHGHKTNACIFDELHVQPNSNLWDAMRTSMTKKKNPMLWVFTTAGVTGTFAEEIHNYAVKVRDGVIHDERWLVRIYGADPADNPFDPKVWEQVNPGWDIINTDAFKASAKEAENSPLFLNTFKRYHLNIWTGSETAFLSVEDWDKCRADIKIENFEGEKCYIGLDYASSRDLTSVCFFFPDQKAVFNMFFCPEDTIDERERTENVNYVKWLTGGLIQATEGNFVDLDTIESYIKNEAKKYDVQAVCIDRAKTDTLRSSLIHHYGDYEGAFVRMTKQGEWLSSAIDQLENWVVNREIQHDGNEIMRWQCDNLSVKESLTTKRKKTQKRNDKARIDGFDALLNCIYEYLEDERNKQGGVSDLYTTEI